ncbi:EcsC family protein [Kovacikia minuta CCNUW1]|uniref:EcsC family protein n=1 Tax=Kovacikia minuta TaxID=2931930 RepID=UPI001CCAA4BF|nr:EcsC family protein [Kovacikia minuta]UBF28104.1 EcsC family protein [Kovacikia minuta CCNUW1]
MSTPDESRSCFEQLNQTIANLFQTVSDAVKETTTTVEETIEPPLHRAVAQSTETIGRIVTPIAENPVVQFATRMPGLRWLMAALGQVNVEEVQREVAQLRQKYPLETPEQLAHRAVVETALKAGGVGLITNFIPPLAITLLALDLVAITALQAKMVYQIATIYGFSLTEPTRRGEVLAIWGLSMGGSGVLKGGLSIVEILPGIGMFVGVTSDITLIYSIGRAASRFYELKRRSAEEDSTDA